MMKFCFNSIRLLFLTTKRSLLSGRPSYYDCFICIDDALEEILDSQLKAFHIP
jgi:hypothetical protein